MSTDCIAATGSTVCEPINETLSELRNECTSFAGFVTELLDQLDQLRDEVDEKTDQLEFERQNVADARSELEHYRQHSSTSPMTDDDARVADLEQQRSELEEELELVRRRAAELAETVSQQKREMAEDRAEWSGELREMRKLLERQTLTTSDVQPAHELVATASSAGGTATMKPPNPVIDEVMAQFEKLQQDATRRRGKKGK